MRAYFFLIMWKKYLDRCSDLHSGKWYSFSKSCISIQSWKIFTSLAESMVLLIIAYRDFYSNFPFFFHGSMEPKPLNMYLDWQGNCTGFHLL